MKTLNSIIIILISCLLTMASCTDFLKEEPLGRIMSDRAFEKPSDIEGAVNVLYRQFGRSQFGITEFIMSMMGDDITTHVASNKAAIREWDLWNISTNNDRLQWNWEAKYLTIKAANFIINGVENTPDAKREDIDYALGQAHYLRAYQYFCLVRAFGPLPKIESLEIDFSIGLSTVAEIYDMIVSDLKIAEEKLLANYSGVPRTMNGWNVVATKGAAQATLACVYMTMAGWPLEMGQEYYRLAAAKALEVIDNSTYRVSLFEEPWMIHSRQYNWDNRECLFGSYFSLVRGTGDGSEAARGAINDIPDCTPGGWTDNRAEIGFFTKFPDGPRKEATYAPWVNMGGSEANGWVYYRWWDERVPENNRSPYFSKSAFISNPDRSNLTEYDHRKSYDAQGTGWVEQTHVAIRLAEVYLWYAEAVGRSGETNARAIELLNRVRNRADGFGPVADRSTVTTPYEGHTEQYTNVYPNGMSANDLAEAAWTEHGWEIAGWAWGAIAFRAHDLHRMNRIKDAYAERQNNPEYFFTDPDTGDMIRVREQFTIMAGDSWRDSKMFAPYPAEEIERNPGLNVLPEEKFGMIK